MTHHSMEVGNIYIVSLNYTQDFRLKMVYYYLEEETHSATLSEMTIKREIIYKITLKNILFEFSLFLFIMHILVM